ncbi:DUF4142 domain-containing protein [Streptomyces orinoci]|uniref:DUF4142 domain-containing protein n=1 Tax=Streptomyces orinoci TaxID=67339 RepID=A0ABV3JSK4_STRON|nr:DUF4142 domain-containing protein [Streptomyces orinoci]
MRHGQRVAVMAATLISASMAVSAQAASGDSGNGTDSAFLKTVHQGNLAEIEAGNDAQTNAVSACVKDVGRVLIRDHTKLDGDVMKLSKQLGVSLPAAPSAEQKQQLADIRAKAGTKSYDSAWLSAQDMNHRATLALIDQQISSGHNAQITAAAKAARPVVAMHLGLVSGGTCREQSASHAVPAGDGGMTAVTNSSQSSAITSPTVIGAVGLGGALATGAVAWGVRRRRNRTAPGPR